VVAPWRAVLALFDAHGAAVQHAGLAPAKGGFQWFNFMCVTMNPWMSGAKTVTVHSFAIEAHRRCAVSARAGCSLTL
jgi:hypothetical protein